MKSLIAIIWVVLIVVLQIYLSKKENKWLGLILPIINFSLSILAALAFFFYAFVPQGDGGSSLLIGPLVIGGMYNIPTIILLLMYYACRGKINKNKELNKMNIQELE